MGLSTPDWSKRGSSVKRAHRGLQETGECAFAVLSNSSVDFKSALNGKLNSYPGSWPHFCHHLTQGPSPCVWVLHWGEIKWMSYLPFAKVIWCCVHPAFFKELKHERAFIGSHTWKVQRIYWLQSRGDPGVQLLSRGLKSSISWLCFPLH